ncbi:MAG TPA: AtpZ/AtpI family protein [Candidatus Hydrogenedentes bacterium]|nr:AtpZ/AtpI family protein [Candidatus Hydrogenedentota bacterium]HPG67454.1 AtpZ/AtpI family protein [Candidatus Hydrogenedentota bacterium]
MAHKEPPRRNDPAGHSSPLRGNPFLILGLASQLGLTVGGGVVAGVAAGLYLDRLVGGQGVVLAGVVLLGLAAGLYIAYKLLRRL